MQIDDLLSDAKKIAAFGQRAGLFANDALFDAIQKAEAVKPLTWASPEAVALQAQVNAAAKVIEPDRLCALLKGWDPFAENRQPKRLRTTLIFCAVLLMIVCGHYTLWNERAAALAEGSGWEIVTKQAAIVDETLLPLVATDADASKPDVIQIAAFMKNERRLQELGLELAQFHANVDWAHESRFFGVSQFKGLVRAVWQNAAPLGSAEAEEAPAGGPAGASDPVQLLGSGACGTQEKLIPAGQAFEAPEETRHPVHVTAAFLLELGALRNCVLSALHVESLDRDNLGSHQDKLFSLKHAVNVVGLWLLPALYGSLGAMIYHMRVFLDPLRPDPKMRHVIARVALGGFAGIIAVWFWTPSFNEAIGVPNVSFGILSFAFLLGFAIEVFFAFLDRLVNLVTSSISRLGTANRAQGSA